MAGVLLTPTHTPTAATCGSVLGNGPCTFQCSLKGSFPITSNWNKMLPYGPRALQS